MANEETPEETGPSLETLAALASVARLNGAHHTAEHNRNLLDRAAYDRHGLGAGLTLAREIARSYGL